MSLKTINVIRWINYDKSEKYSIKIFEDDNLEDGVSKIALSINSKSRFYVWNNNFPELLYSIEDVKWKGYNNNPLKSTDRNNSIIKQPIIYKYKYGLCYFNKINIIFEDDFKDLKNNHYYFTEKKVKSLDELKKREDKLLELEKKETKTTENRINVHRYELKGHLSSKYQYLADVYDKLNTNDFVQYIQWVNDNYTLVHKLYMYHSISSNNLKSWTNIDKITDTRCINCYCPLNSSSTIKITIHNDMSITINFILDLRKNVVMETIEKIIQNKIKLYLQSVFEEKINITPVAIKIFNYISISNVSIEKLAKVISSYQDVFKSISFKKSINLIYKRSSNFTNDSFDYNIYVRNRLILGVDKKEIIEELVTFNITEEEALKIIEQEIDFLNELEQQKIKADLTEQKLNTIVVIKPSKTGFDIIIHNIPNKTELGYLTFWLSKIVSSAQETVVVTKKKVVKPVTPPSSSSSTKSDESVDLGKISYSSSGGAKNDDKDRYKITLLQNTDKELFGENYARDKCQKKNQPLVIDKETRNKLKEDGKYYVDNEVYYGSKKENMNYYICPRYWCKVSKVPAHPETGECPIPDEEKIESFFDNPGEVGVKRYVHLVKPNKENDICAPCCFKKPPKEADLGKCKNYETYDPKNLTKGVIDEKDENYLVNANAPINPGRYGVVPKQLHELLSFSTSIKADKILVRKGIIHKASTKDKVIHTDSLIFALSYLLNFDKKQTFISDLIAKMDLITYMSLENGNVCKAFMDRLPIIPNENLGLINELQEYLKKFPAISELYKLDFNKHDYRLSRFLAIFKSYKKFINYLSANDYTTPKSSYFIYAMISIIYNKLLVIWDKLDDNISILCPYYTSFDDLIAIMEINPEVIMLLKDGKYYEPLEIRFKNKETTRIFKLNDYPKLEELLKSCSANNKNYDINDKIYRDIYTLNNWIKTKVVLDNYSKFLFETILINNDLTIEHFLTKTGILITIDKIGISFLPRIIKDLNIKRIAFYDDYVSKTFNINISLKDLETFKNKVLSLGTIKYNIGVLDTDKPQKEPVNQLFTILTIEPKDLGNTNIIHSRVEDDLYFYDKFNETENKKWFQLQMMVFNKLLKELDEDKLKKLQSLPRIDYINKIMSFFTTNPDKNKIRIIIEEIPIYSINHIKNYLNKMTLYYKYNFLDSNIIKDEKRKQFQFSQVALNKGMDEIINYHKSAPLTSFNKEKEMVYEFDNKTVKEDTSKLPELMKGTFEPLNSKWVMHKKSKWYLMEILKVDYYQNNYFREFFEWFANFIHIKTSYQNLLDITVQKLIDYRNNENVMKTLFKDKTIFNVFSLLSGKFYKNVNVYWEKHYSKLTNNQKLELIDKIKKDGLHPNDLMIITMSEILNISILIIHRAVYGTTKNDDIRGGLDDLIVSSTFIKALNNYKNRPLLIFFKLTDEDEITNYHLVFNKTTPVSTKSFYLKLDDIPNEIKLLIEEHIRLDENKDMVLLK